MAQFKSYNMGGIAPSLGQAAGRGVSGALEGLAQQKLQQLQTQRGAKALEALRFSPEEAQALSMADPRIIQEAVKARLKPPSAIDRFFGGLQSVFGANQPSQGGQPYQPAVQALSRFAPGEGDVVDSSLGIVGPQAQPGGIPTGDQQKLLHDPYFGGTAYQTGSAFSDILREQLPGLLKFISPPAPERGVAPISTPQVKEGEGFADAFGRSLKEYPIPALGEIIPTAFEKAAEVPQKLGMAAQKALESITDFEKIQPKDFVSEAFQLAGSNAPYMLLGAGNWPQRLISNLGGSAGLVGAKRAGAGTLGQIAGSFLGSGLANKGFNYASKWMGNKTLGEIPKLKAELYDKVRDQGKDISIDTRPIRKKLHEIATKVQETPVSGSRFNQAEKSALLSDLQGTESSFLKGGFKSSAAQLAERIKELNANWAPPTTVKGKFYNQMIDSIKDELSTVAKKHPQWGDAWKTANELHSIDKWQQPFAKILEQPSVRGLFTKAPLLSIALRSMGVPLPTQALIASSAYLGSKGGSELGKIAQRIPFLLKSEAGRKVMGNIVANSAKGNVAGTKLALEQLGKLTNKISSGFTENK